MKTILLCCVAIAAFLSFSACADHERRHEHGVHSSTTTTEETTTRRPVGATTETRTIRAY